MLTFCLHVQRSRWTALTRRRTWGGAAACRGGRPATRGAARTNSAERTPTPVTPASTARWRRPRTPASGGCPTRLTALGIHVCPAVRYLNLLECSLCIEQHEEQYAIVVALAAACASLGEDYGRASHLRRKSPFVAAGFALTSCCSGVQLMARACPWERMRRLRWSAWRTGGDGRPSARPGAGQPPFPCAAISCDTDLHISWLSAGCNSGDHRLRDGTFGRAKMLYCK